MDVQVISAFFYQIVISDFSYFSTLGRFPTTKHIKKITFLEIVICTMQVSLFEMLAFLSIFWQGSVIDYDEI